MSSRHQSDFIAEPPQKILQHNDLSGLYRNLLATRKLTFTARCSTRPESIFLAFPSLVSNEHMSFRAVVRDIGPDLVYVSHDCGVQELVWTSTRWRYCEQNNVFEVALIYIYFRIVALVHLMFLVIVR